ncbi:hypothetical protein F4821DRAFT_262586 [Hypoxylon rubiginosum]|uniref:Uncharacterized protein n=1 Tax=Hypoxylon rubiginosum TaxID=110542 RepID=A0ACC0CTR3_9PEZI|nr:hypothetical protein F4821DRAFT_262586 [Hypoxylon rubiginosum]
MAQQSSPSAGSRGNKDSKPSGDSNEVVAVLYMKQRILSKVDKNLVEAEKSDIDLPRWKRIVDVPSPDGERGDVRATVDLWQLGIGYNMSRMLGNRKKLYVVTR